MQPDYYDWLPVVATAQEMAAMDRRTIEEIGIPGLVLMENAGRKVAEVCKELLQQCEGKKVVIICGKGNNGGDGYVVARHLQNSGAQTEVYLIGEHKEVRGDAVTNLNILKNLNIDVLPITDWSPASDIDLIIDAILGTGVRGPLKEEIVQIVNRMNEVGAPVVSIDLPTGVETDTGAVYGACVQARCTVTMAHLKRGLLFSPGREHAGEVIVADIGIPKRVTRESGAKCFQISPKYIKMVLPKRPRNIFKNRCGQVLLVSGSIGLTGAATLSSEAALRIGAGMAILGCPKSLNAILEEKLTEVMTLPLPETSQQTISFEAKDILAERFEWSDVIAIGPGMTTHGDTFKLVKWLLNKYDKTVVMDADAINCLKDNPNLLKSSRSKLVLTPHPGELARLIGKTTKEIISNPIEIARETAQKFNIILVLKGAPTVIADADGNVFINSTGNPGMATAGMGDVLTGVIAGLISQGLRPVDGALAGVYLHGLAGDLVKQKIGQNGLLAGDVLRTLPEALKQFE